MTCKTVPIALFVFFLAFSSASSLFGYTYNKATSEPLSVVMEKPAEAMKQTDTPLPVKTVFRNSGDTALELRLTFTTIEMIEFEGTDAADKRKLAKSVTVPAKGKAELDIAVIGRSGTLDFHYPIYLDIQWNSGDKANRLEAVLPFESNIRPNPNWPTNNPMLGKTVENPGEMPLHTIPVRSGLMLAKSTTYRGFWTQDKTATKETVKPIGWIGTDPTSSASASRTSIVRGGVARQSFSMHPSYKGGPGSVGVEYRIRLPQTDRIVFSGFGAMRDTAPGEPDSDGVTFRVGVKEIAATGQAGPEKIVAEKHLVSKNWEAVDADLSSYAGKDVLFRLIADPGPKRNTTCDGCFWGDPLIYAGPKPLFADPEASAKRQAELHDICVEAFKAGRANDRKTLVFPLAGGARAAVVFGENGFVDGKIAVGTPEKFVVYDGVKISVKDNPIAQWPTTLAAGSWTPGRRLQSAPDTWTWTQDVALGDEKATMKYTLKFNGPALQLSVDCSEPTWITSIQMGSTDQAAERVYYGHGYCIVKPEKFTVGADGHRMSTSHVGMDYPRGVSVLLASTMFPASFTVDSERKIATTVTRPGTTFTLLPGDKGIFDCAVRYRSINPKKAAPGVKTKAGRLCFDIWGGSYARHVEIIDNAIRYGATDSLFIVHNWQRYGYDNRLPDIWPPNPRWGTLAEMQEALKKCDEAGILYGLHDNYIDIYPDAEGYGTDKVSFNADGQPRKAWFNRGIQARSYQFRPDVFLPVLNRNFDLMLPHLPQTCYFVDVFSSAGPNDFYDRDGKPHTRAETNDHWNECFDVIRDRLTEVSRSRQKLPDDRKKEFFAPSISEAGHDALIGHLDGADCQFMYVAKKPGGDFRTVISCEDIIRVPWYDAVNHTNFSQHGVGYSGRYESGRGRLLHGIESDDYLASEVMTGHALMVDYGSAFRGAVRKYWLLQPTVRRLADSEIASVQYVDGDIHRQKITWISSADRKETTVYVNRGDRDWTVSGVSNPAAAKAGFSGEFVLPRFGFLVDAPEGAAAIFRDRNGRVAEMSCDGRRFFVNGRNRTAGGVVPIAPSMKPESFRYLGDNRFRCEVLWTAETGTKADRSIFVHLVAEDPKHKGNNSEGIRAVYGCEKKTPSTSWEGEVVTPMHPSAIPHDAPAGKYRLLVGLWNPSDGSRETLTGHDGGGSRYSIGILDVVRDESGKVADIRYENDTPIVDPLEAELRRRLVPPKQPVAFGLLSTKGAFLWEAGENGTVTVTPLPEEPAANVSFDAVRHPVSKVTAFDADGKKIRDVPLEKKDGISSFNMEKDEFRYVLK